MSESAETKAAALRTAVSNAVAQSIEIRPGSTGTLLVTIEINLSQGGIGQTYITEQFRTKLT